MTDRKKALIELRDKVKAECAERHRNARQAGKEGWGTHRNAGDSGRVASLWMESKAEVERIEALIAQEDT